MSNTSKKNTRIIILISLLGVLALYILIRFAMIMLWPPADTPRDTPTFPLVERGPILDREGRLLAISTRLDSVTGWGPHVEDVDETARILSEVLNKDFQETLELIESRKSGFFYVERKITPAQSNRLRDIMSQGKLRGIQLELEFGRRYPQKNLVSHLLGYVGIDNTGLAGIEYSLNPHLMPPQIGMEELVGNSVYLTIDLPLQYQVHNIASEAFEENNPDSLMLVVAKARTGEILSYTSLPDYDPNRFTEFPRESRYNRPLAFTYEPGSVFKIFTLASFLDAGVVSAQDSFFSRGYYERILPSGEQIRINDLAPPGNISTEEILVFSSNAGIGFASDRMDQEIFHNYLRSYGFGQSSGFPLVGETQGILAAVENWSGRTKPTISMGQEIGVSALQLISAATVLANDGILLKPRLIRKILSGNSQVLSQTERTEVRRVLSPGVSAEILEMMKTTAEIGGSRRIQIPGINISAKTGTAEVLDPETGEYSSDVFIASNLAIFPTENPQYIVYVAMEHPKGESHFGGVIAAPVAKRVIETLIEYYGIPKAGDTVIAHNAQVTLPETPRMVPGELMPDLSGMSKRQVLPLLGSGNQVRLIGEGWVVSQEPEPGVRLQDETNIQVYFE